MITKFKRQTAFSMVELMLALSVIAILIAASTGYYFLASRHSEINRTTDQIARIVAAAEEWRGTGKSYIGISIAALGDLGAFYPEEYDKNTKILRSAWNTIIELNEYNGGKLIQIAFPGIPESACNRLVGQFEDQYSYEGGAFCDEIKDNKARFNYIGG